MNSPQPTVACKACGKPTPMLGTQLCDECWEERRSGRLTIAVDALRQIAVTTKGYPNGSREGELAIAALKAMGLQLPWIEAANNAPEQS